MPICSECEAHVAGDDVNPHLPASGLYFDPYGMGYHGGLLDLFPCTEGQLNLAPWLLCENCAKKFFETFPNLKKTLDAYICYLAD